MGEGIRSSGSAYLLPLTPFDPGGVAEEGLHRIFLPLRSRRGTSGGGRPSLAPSPPSFRLHSWGIDPPPARPPPPAPHPDPSPSSPPRSRPRRERPFCSYPPFAAPSFRPSPAFWRRPMRPRSPIPSPPREAPGRPRGSSGPSWSSASSPGGGRSPRR